MNAKILLVIGLILIFCFPAAYGENFSKVIIITPDELYDQAKDLADFYNKTIPTEVYKTSDFENLSELGVNFLGYSDDSLCGWEEMKNLEDTGKFDYTLAKKIRRFLSDQDSSYVILFGNATAIPPSYYYFDKYYLDPTDKYNSWVPTDLFYAVFDENLTIRHSVGRILVNNRQEASAMVEKLKSYNKTISRIALFGGKMFDGDYEYMGEIGALHALKNLNLNYTKFFESDGNFTSSKLEGALKNYDVVFHFGHGSGAHACFSDYCISGDFNTNSSAIFVSVACMNGAYDSTIVPIWNYYTKSFAEDLLKNDAVAYVGGSRVNYGWAWIFLNNGSVDYYGAGDMNEILEYFMTSNKSTTGKAYIDAYKKMIDEGLDLWRLRTIMEFVLLGSPLLKFEKNKINLTEENLTINVKGDTKKTIDSSYEGIYGTLPVFYKNKSISINCSSSLNEDTFIKVIYVYDSTTVAEGKNSLNFSPDKKGLYMIKCENRNEKRFYLKVEDNITYASILTADYYTVDTNNNSLYDSFNVVVSVNISENGIYVVEGKIDIAGIYIASTSNKTNLTKGINNVTLRFDGKKIRSHKMNGNFNIGIKIYKIYKDNTRDLQDEVSGLQSDYYKYTQFESPASSFIKFSDYGYGVNITIDATKNGTYTIDGDVYCNKTKIEDVHYSKNLTEGIREILIPFNKSLITNKCAFGEIKFSFKNVALHFNNSKTSDDFRCVALVTTYPELVYGNCSCDSCEKCSKKISDPNCKEINLTYDINFADKTCINPLNFTNKVFNCNGHKIRGFFGYISGIYLNNAQNATIKNCAISNFFEGIEIKNASNISLINNSISSNKDNGIYAENSSIFVDNNHISSNKWHGISIMSSNTTITKNFINSNTNAGIFTFDSLSNIINNNILNNNKGIYIFDSLSNITNNTILHNNNEGAYIDHSSSNIINNTILHNHIGIFLDNSDSIVNANIIRGNRNLDIYSNSPSSYGDNNVCDKYEGWKDNSTDNGCSTKCRKAKDIFDEVEILEYLSGEKDYDEINLCVDVNNDGVEDLSDALDLMTKISTE